MTVGMTTPANIRLPALKLIESSRTAWRLANALLTFLAICIVAMLFVPWQQSAKGTGRVVAYVPQERQQTVTSPVKGVVLQVAEGLREGMRVKKGDFILEIEPNAANLRDQLMSQVQDLNTKLATAQVKSEVYAQNVIDFQAAQIAAVDAADELVEAAKAKWDAELQLAPGYEAKELQARLNHERQRGLSEKGIKAQVEVEKFKKDWDVAKSDLESLKMKITAAMDEWQAKQNERIQKEREAKTKVDYARAMQQDALGQIATIQKEKRDLEIKLAELDRMKIYRSARRYRLSHAGLRAGADVEGRGCTLHHRSRHNRTRRRAVGFRQRHAVGPARRPRAAAVRGLARRAVCRLAFGGSGNVRRRSGGRRSSR